MALSLVAMSLCSSTSCEDDTRIAEYARARVSGDPGCVAERVQSVQPVRHEYFVDHSGRDSYPGTASQPFATLARAASVLAPGDTLYIRGGVYTDPVTFEISGTAERPITVSAYPGEKVTFDGANNTVPSSSTDAFISVTGDWYNIRHLEISRSGGAGIQVDGHHCTVDGVYVRQCSGSGIIITGWYGLVQNSRAWNNSLLNEHGRVHRSWGFGISACRHPRYTILRHNTVWENWGEGISTFESDYIVIEENVSYNNYQNFYISDTQHTALRRNLSYCTPNNPLRGYETQNGILIGDERRNPPSSDNIITNNFVTGCERNLAAGALELTNGLIANNTFVEASGTGLEPANVMFFEGAVSNGRFENNIVEQRDGSPLCHMEARGVILSANNWSRVPPERCTGTDDAVGEPGLLKGGSFEPGGLQPQWFMLGPGSPAIGRGKFLPEVLDDFFGRPRGEKRDIGGHQYTGATAPPEGIRPSTRPQPGVRIKR